MLSIVDEFDQHRTVLFNLAYRMLGSVMDAEDIVQEAFLRWHNAPHAEIDSARAYMMTIVSRLCLDHLQRAYVQREEYIGDWLPEPLLISTEDDPAHRVELTESISTAFLLLLEKLSPLDRAVFLLHDVFNYTFTEIATMVDKNPADCRQIGYRARQRLLNGRTRFTVKTETTEAIVQQFLQACIHDDLLEILALLAPDVRLISDSGGKVRAARNVLVGPDRAGRFMLGIFRKWHGRIAHITTINGQPAIIEWNGDRVICVSTFDIHEGQIQAIYRVLNPDKLQGLGRV